ncbi:unnamed protein product, partial [Rotaria sordida]
MGCADITIVAGTAPINPPPMTPPTNTPQLTTTSQSNQDVVPTWSFNNVLYRVGDQVLYEGV